MKPQVSFEELEATIRARVCAACTDRTSDALCLLEDPNHCALFQLFPLVVQAVLATESAELEPYVNAIHEHVCSVCVDQQIDGACPRRGQGCSLDAYLPQIVDAIEEVTGKHFDRKSLTGLPPVR